MVCVFCLKHESRKAEGCTYGGRHEFAEASLKLPQSAKLSAPVCGRCGRWRANAPAGEDECRCGGSR